jgi:hypothetical protein
MYLFIQQYEFNRIKRFQGFPLVGPRLGFSDAARRIAEIRGTTSMAGNCGLNGLKITKGEGSLAHGSRDMF